MPQMHKTTRAVSGFSLIELVIVVVIIGIIGAIAVPRLSRGSEGANSSALKQDLAVMNKAIELYAAEHGGEYPSPFDFEDQMLRYSSFAGDTSAVPGKEYPYGPYLRAIPPAPGGEYPGSRVVGSAPAEGVGWVYNHRKGIIVLNRGAGDNATASQEDSALGRLLDGLGL